MARIIENPKQLILGKAKEILYNHGYSRLSMRNLSKECGIALGTIYNYYPTKKDLIIEMMIEYWQSCLNSVRNIEASYDDIYVKLNKIFDELRMFVESFRQYWLTPELYNRPEYVQSGVKEEYILMEELIRMIQDILEKEQNSSNIQIKLGSYETASFIIMNFVTMIHMPFFKYSSFEVFLKELLIK